MIAVNTTHAICSWWISHFVNYKFSSGIILYQHVKGKAEKCKRNLCSKRYGSCFPNPWQEEEVTKDGKSRNSRAIDGQTDISGRLRSRSPFQLSVSNMFQVNLNWEVILWIDITYAMCRSRWALMICWRASLRAAMHHWNGSSHSHYSGLTLSSRASTASWAKRCGVVHAPMQKVEEASRMTRGFVVGGRPDAVSFDANTARPWKSLYEGKRTKGQKERERERDRPL